MNSEEKSDARYFPSETETNILVNYLKIYFSNPERSVKRSQVVQDVVKILSEMNSHWNHRTVRLWFNNNKKLLGHSQPQQNSQPSSQETMFDAPVQIVPKNVYLPPRPASAATVLPYFDQSNYYDQNMYAQQQYQPVQQLLPSTISMVPPKPTSISAQLETQKELLSQPQPIDVYNRADQMLHNAILNSNIQKWDEFVLPQTGQKSIFDRNSISYNAHQFNYTLPVDITPFDTIDASYCSNKSPAIIISDKTLTVEKHTVELPLTSYATSITVNPADGSIWTYSGNTIYGIDTNLELIAQVSTGNHVSKSAALTFLDDQLVFATNSYVSCWSLSGIQENSMSLGFSTYMTSISAISPIGDCLLLSSCDNHSIYMFAKQGLLVQRFVGHCAGVTSLSTVNENIFLTGSADQTIRIWDKRQGPQLTLCRHNGIVTSVCASDDGNLIASGGTDNIVRVWDLRKSEVCFGGKCSSPPQSLALNDNVLTVVTSEAVEEKYYNNCKFIDPVYDENIPQNGLLHYQIF